MFSRVLVAGLKRSAVMASSVNIMSRPVILNMNSLSQIRSFSVESKEASEAAKKTKNEQKAKMSEEMKKSQTKVADAREKEAKDIKKATGADKKQAEAKVVAETESHKVVDDGKGNKVTIQTKAEDAAGNIPITPELKKLADTILGLNWVDTSLLFDYLMKKTGFNADFASMPMAAAPAANGGANATPKKEEKKVEKTNFTIKLVKFNAADKIKVIKEVRGITGLGLKESKALVEGAPSNVKENVPKDEANAMVEKLKAVGATIELI
ncbi:hypothetical protein WA158_004482 [Blastocystis sp. Blastoise]